VQTHRLKQQNDFPNHKVGDKTDDHSKTKQETLKYCKTEQRKAQSRDYMIDLAG
jgi:hypothetical protein